MKGFTLIIVGYQGAGKSLLVKDIIKKVSRDRIRVFDVNDEYSDFTDVDYRDEDGVLDKEAFRNDMITLKDTIFVVEDATVIFSNRKGYDEKLAMAIIGKRHSHNVYIFLFHAMRVIPVDVYEFSDELWLLKTADKEKTVYSKYDGTGAEELWEEVKSLPEFEWSEKQQVPIRDTHYKVMQIKRGKTDRTVERMDK